MTLGYNRNEIMKILDQYLDDVNKGFENQIGRMKKEEVDPELGLATLLTSSMLSMLDAVAGTIEMNNKKLLEDLQAKGLLKSE